MAPDNKAGTLEQKETIPSAFADTISKRKGLAGD
jgi:hypothetical protein